MGRAWECQDGAKLGRAPLPSRAQRCPGIPWMRIPHGIPGSAWKSSSMSGAGTVPPDQVAPGLGAGMIPAPSLHSQDFSWSFPPAAANSGFNPGSLGNLFLLGTATDPLPIPGFLGLGGFGIPQGMAVIQQRNENRESPPFLPS